MSCCQSCSQGHGCESGLSGLAGLLGALTIAAGSEVKIGFEFNLTATIQEANQGAADPGFMREVIAGSVYGIFDSVNVTIQSPAYAGLQNGYILIQGRLWQDVASVTDLESAIERAVSDTDLPIQITRRDPLAVLSVPSNRQNIQQPFDTSVQQQTQPGQCNWAQQSIGDYVACQLGISSPIGGVAAGTFGGLAAAGVIALLAVVFLKRI